MSASILLQVSRIRWFPLLCILDRSLYKKRSKDRLNGKELFTSVIAKLFLVSLWICGMKCYRHLHYLYFENCSYFSFPIFLHLSAVYRSWKPTGNSELNYLFNLGLNCSYLRISLISLSFFLLRLGYCSSTFIERMYAPRDWIN